MKNNRASIAPSAPWNAKAAVILAWMFLLGRPHFAEATEQKPEGWKFQLGAGMVSAPKYPGSNRLDWFFFPDLEATYDDWFFANLIDGVGAGFSPVKNLTLSAALGVDLDERKASDDPRLKGLGDITYAPDLRLNAHYDFSPFFLDGTLHSRLGPASGRGTFVVVDAGCFIFKEGPHYVSAGLTGSWMDSIYARNFFGISAVQSAASGLQAFRAHSGPEDLGGFVEADFNHGQSWNYFVRIDLTRLVRPIAGSPIVQQAFQPSLELTAAYRF